MALLHTLTEDFTSAPTIPGAKWNSQSGFSVAGGQATITTPDSTQSFLASPTGWDMRTSYFGLRLISGPTADANADVELQITSSGGQNLVQLPIYNGNYYLRYWNSTPAQVDVSSVAFGGAPVWVAVGLDGNVLKWLRSADSATWVLLGSIDVTTVGRTAADYSNVYAGVVSQGFGGSGHASTVIDNVNLFTNSPFTVSGGGSPPTNSTAPTITGTPASGATITGHLGTWTNTPTSYSYEFRWVRNSAANEPAGVTYTTIPGTSGTTSSSATAPTYVMGKTDASRSILFHVTATNASGSASVDSSPVIFYTAKVPFKTSGNPFKTAITAPVYNSELSAALRAQLTSWYGETRKWWLQGGAYADAYSSYLHVVDSSMTRTPFILTDQVSISNPRTAPVQNGSRLAHLAWTFGTKNGGVPTPPGGFLIPAGSDKHICVYVEDTKEYYEMWVADKNPVSADWGGATVHADYVGQSIFVYGGYIRDVTTHPGFWNPDVGASLDGYRIDTDGNREYAGWGAMATSLAYFQLTMQMSELVTDGTLGHAVGVVTPGSSGAFNWPAQRRDFGAGGSLPQGGIWTIDPSVNIPGLTSLGDADSNTFRNQVAGAIQQYGATNCDSTGNDIIVRMEGLPGTWPVVPGSAPTGAQSFDAIMQSIPNSAWRVMSPSWRPAGVTLNPKTATVTDTWGTVDSAKWQTGGTVAVSSNQLRLTATTSGSAVWPTDWGKQSLVGSTAMTQLVQASGTDWCRFQIQPRSDNYSSPGIVFNVLAGNLRCELYDYFGTKVGSDSVVAYNATNHRWLRFRMNSDHSVDWQTSPGGTAGTLASTWTWTTQRTATPAWDLEQANQEFAAKGGDGTAIFANLNVSPSAAPGSTVDYARHVRGSGARVVVNPHGYGIS